MRFNPFFDNGLPLRLFASTVLLVVSWLITGAVVLQIVWQSLGDIEATFVPLVGAILFLVSLPVYWMIDIICLTRASHPLLVRLAAASLFPIVVSAAYFLVVLTAAAP